MGLPGSGSAGGGNSSRAGPRLGRTGAAGMGLTRRRARTHAARRAELGGRRRAAASARLGASPRTPGAAGGRPELGSTRPRARLGRASTGRHAGTTRALVRAAPCADAGCAPTADAGGSASRPDLGIASGGTCCARGSRRRWMESTAIAFLGRRAAPGSAGPGHHRLGIAARQLPARGAACPFLERAGRRFFMGRP